MVLEGLSKEQIEMIYQSIKINPMVDEGDKVDIQKLIRMKLEEQVDAGVEKA